jgi:hypothetical protein
LLEKLAKADASIAETAVADIQKRLNEYATERRRTAA